jgi:hypothetical protein
MMVFIAAFGGALLTLGYWALILWIGARSDRKYLRAEEARGRS